nr:MAG TPA: major capsid protein [Caudoviricetes sp.]
MAKHNYDCAGMATKYGVLCTDGKTIMPGAFKDQDGTEVPVVWMHQHNSIDNVLGHALLKSCPEGLRAYVTFNDTEKGQMAKTVVKNRDINSFSIWADSLRYAGDGSRRHVAHGIIREVSLVLAGANPGAHIEEIMAHGAEETDIGVIYSDIDSIDYDSGEFEDTLEHSAEKREESKMAEEHKPTEEKPTEEKPTEEKPAEEKQETVKDVYDAMSDKQKQAVKYMLGMALGDKNDKTNKEEPEMIKHNVFDKNGHTQTEDVLSHDAMATIFNDAQKGRLTLKEATEDYLSHAEGDYGIKDIGTLFPEYHELNKPPKFIDRDQTAVAVIMNGVKHVPFSRVKTTFADITADEARARGYTKGKKKIEEVFTLLKRTTDPQTIYKKQKFDRDDIIDITDFDVVSWVKVEMRGKLDEELARAIMVGDGRSSADDSKISETHIRPIWKDDDMFAIKRVVEEGTGASDLVNNILDDAIRARKEYRGSGNPAFFTTEDVLAEMLLLKDKNGRRIFKSVEELATAMRVSRIVTSPLLENQTRETDPTGGNKDVYTLQGIMVNLSDYTVGADKGGAVSLFDDFDIDYNQYKYLIETRCSGALTVPKSAIVFETKKTTAA